MEDIKSHKKNQITFFNFIVFFVIITFITSIAGAVNKSKWPHYGSQTSAKLAAMRAATGASFTTAVSTYNERETSLANGKYEILFDWEYKTRGGLRRSGTNAQVTYHPAKDVGTEDYQPAHFHTGAGGGLHFHWDPNF